LVVRYLPELPVWVGASPSNAEVVVVAPVPPFATGKAVPEYDSASVPDVVTGLPVTDKNAGAEMPTLVTVPEPPPLEYCGMFSVLLINVAAPLVPLVVSVIGAW
jgi:hypothetical protein